MGRLVWLISRFWLNGLYGLVVEFGQQLALWIALCVTIVAVFFFCVEHFVPPVVECILCGFKPFLLLLQAPRGGKKSLLEVLLFQVFFRDDECIVVRTVLFSGGRLMSSALRIAVIGRLFRAVFGVTWLILLHRWVHGVVVFFGINRGIIIFCAVVAVFTVAGFRAASMASSVSYRGDYPS